MVKPTRVTNRITELRAAVGISQAELGDRIADRTCTTVDGPSVRLYDGLGPEWALLGPEALADIARERLGDVVALRGERDALLVRPDGHLAWRGTDAAGLRAWLDNALGEPAGVLTP